MKALLSWYSQARAEQWHRLAIGRLVDALVAGEIVAWSGKEPIPASWWESDVDLDVQTGSVYGPNDRHRPLAGELQLYREGDKPALVREREVLAAAEGGTRYLISAAFDDHREMLQGMDRRDAQISWLRGKLPASVPLSTLSARLREEFGRVESRGPRRRGPSRKANKRASSWAWRANA